MISAALYLTRRTFLNRLRVQVRRLRSPRYSLAFLFGLAYLWFFLGGSRRHGAAGLFGTGPWFVLGGSLVLAAVVARWWILGGDQSALAFTPAEVDFLFPAPVRRRDLILFKLLRAQWFLLLNTVLWTVLLRGHGQTDAWLRAGALWVLFSTLFLHRLGVSLTRTSVVEYGALGIRRRGVTLALLAVGAAGLTFGLGAQLPELKRAWEFGLPDFLDTLKKALQAPLPSAVLLPFRLLLRPVAARPAGAWLVALAPALALMLAHYLWVIRSDHAFEETALRASAKRAEDLARVRGHGVLTPPRAGVAPRAWFPLAPIGRPATAISWKNLIAATRGVRPGFMLFLLSVAVVAGFALGVQGLGALGLTWCCFAFLLGAQWVRYDLRRDLSRHDLLRTFPIPGSDLVASEVAASALVLTAYQYLLLGLAVPWLISDPPEWLRAADVAGAVLGALMLIPAVNLFTLGVQNAGALLFPAWVRREPRGGGIEMLGQQFLTAGASLILLALALLLPAGVGAGLYTLLRPWLHGWELVPAVGAVAAGLLLENLLLFRWLGGVFTRLEPVADL